MRFALVTPTLNAGRLLDVTVASVLQCLDAEDRYTIVDGGSTDGSVERVTATLPQNARVMRDGGGGMYDAIACGFAATEGDRMGWINASDLLLPGALDVVRRTFALTNADLLHFDDLLIDDHGVVIRRTIGTTPRLLQAMRVGWTPLQDGCFWTRALYERCGGIDARYRLAGDYDFFLRAFHAGRAVYVPRVVSAFRAHEGQLSHARRDAYQRERTQVRAEFLREHPQLAGSSVSALAERTMLSLRARGGRNRRATPLAGQAWHTVKAGAP